MGKVIDLFCGCGGFSEGFKQAGHEVVCANDFWKPAIETYRKNHSRVKLIAGDIREEEVKNKILKYSRNTDIIIGSPPCQGFSIAGQLWTGVENDSRNDLVDNFIEFLSVLQPPFFVIENVANMLEFQGQKVKNKIIRSVNSIGYKCRVKVLNSANYGVPQLRYRAFFIGNNTETPVKFPMPTHCQYDNFTLDNQRLKRWVTIKEVIHDLIDKDTQEISNHIPMNHSQQMLLKMGYIKNGGNRKTIPLDIRPTTGDSRKYIRYNSKKPSVCITGDMRKVFHYELNRALTVRELARIQTFSDNYIFYGGSIEQQQQVGDAVPPLLAKLIAKSIN